MKNLYVYGVKTLTGEHIDVSNTERGAKNYATRHGYTVITLRNTNHYYVVELAYRQNGKWFYIPSAENILAARTRVAA